jgi:uncharacterized protein
MENDPDPSSRRARPDAAEADPGSPCVSTCRIDPASGWCDGCLRTLDEIAAWGTMDAADKRRTWAQLPQRRATAAARRERS